MAKKNNYRDSIIEALEAAETVQDFLFKDKNLSVKTFEESRDEYIKCFQKRVDKITEININNPSWKIELKKRVLQQASLSIKLLQYLSESE